MKIVFLGSSEFAVAPLRNLLDSRHALLCVVTQSDKKRGRHLRIFHTPVKEISLQHNLNLYQPQDVNGPQAIEFLKGLRADIFIVSAYGFILSQQILDIPRLFAVNLHPSLLPLYRGAAPINWAIIKGEKMTGVSLIKMSQKMDAGEIILQRSTEIYDHDTAITLGKRLSELASCLLLQSLDLIERNQCRFIRQDEAKATFAPRLKKQDGLIRWQDSARQINNLIRGTLPWPGAFTYYRGRLLKIYAADRGDIRVSGVPGEILEVSKSGILVATGKDGLWIKELQTEGKRRMKVEEFILGHKIITGEILGALLPHSPPR
jgi:methionyl-tRNA formyltransferase